MNRGGFAKAGQDRSKPRTESRVRTARVNDHDYHSVLSSLNSAVEILDRNRTPDPAFIAAYDTLKQSRAMIVKALGTTSAPQLQATGSVQLAA
jgi:hypothetical protein